MNWFLDYFQQFDMQMSDVLDILIIWLIVYILLKNIQGSRSMQMALGLMALFLIRILADYFNMVVLSRVIGSLFSIIPIAILVLFQNEIRKLLASLGRTPLFIAGKDDFSEVYQEIFKAAEHFSERRVGALIVFEREDSLKSYAESGVPLDALPSFSLFSDIFQPKSQLHDGAVIFANQRLASAACILPLSNSTQLPKHYGTRHRAAIGISEETDALTLIVSEETGAISFAFNGRIFRPKNSSVEEVFALYRVLMYPGRRSRNRWIYLQERFKSLFSSEGKAGKERS